MDAQTNFSEILLARRARDERELVAMYAALIAHGTEIDAKSVAAMTPQLHPDLVSVAMRALDASGRLRRANERVVEFQGKHAIAELWGSGKTASSDMMSLNASKHLYNARIDPRRRTHAVGLYTHVLDQHGIIYDQPIVLNERQAGAAIEGVVRYNEGNSRRLGRVPCTWWRPSAVAGSTPTCSWSDSAVPRTGIRRIERSTSSAGCCARCSCATTSAIPNSTARSTRS